MFNDAATQHNDPIVLKLSSLIEIRLSQLKYFTFLIIGIALLWPWNCFLSASAYYGTRFINSPSLIKIYSSTMMSVSTITSAIFNYVLSQQQTGVNYKNRVKFGFNMTIVIFVFMAITCITQIFIDMNDKLFFAILMIMVLLSAAATCFAQNGTMAIVNVMGSIYANSVMVGQAVAGVLPSLALIFSILAVGDKTLKEHKVEKDFGVFIYYITASLVCILSISLLYLVNKYKEHTVYERLDELIEEEHGTTEVEQELEEEEEPVTQKQFVPFSQLWSKLSLIVMTIFLTFSITLAFPVFASVVESTSDQSSYKFFNKQIYIPFIYLIWNLGDLLGRVLCGYPKLKMLITNPKVLIIYSISRLVFIPLFLTCNTKPGVSIPLINSDIWYILLQLLFGISNGQLCTSSFMIVGKFCDNDDEKEAAGGFTTVFLSFGLMAGSVFSYLLVLFIS
ncbi:hypothetical protein KGF54_001895 [Candida jiufengensis]|uniref:uncharacterized protein n=1 Tax=Candida jiufengensis TaxID=497108 RepID=UPI00222453C0|nr:uncharacterized protein KGF54_001895 [Candida jiufengensis]KAI5955334.1 hypothetical protein KGF54_001895 [Candida jiufengensis]